MTPTPLSIYIEWVRSSLASTPAMIGEAGIFSLLSTITGQHIMSYDDLIDASVSNIFVYDIPEDKKEFNIETVRKCIIDIELMPYEWKHIYILRHFDTATLYAQNAILKILEDCPVYAVILLEVPSGNSVIETIRSRCIDLTQSSPTSNLSTQSRQIVDHYIHQEYRELVRSLYLFKCSSEEAILILRSVYPYLDETNMEKCDIAIDSLSSTHENPRSILDVFFL